MFERSTVWAGEQGQSTKFLQFERDAAKSLAQFVLDAMGSQNAAFTGLSASPGTGLTVNIGAGALYQYGQIDPTAWSGLSADTWQGTLLGLVLSTQNLTGFVAPTTSGQSINYLIQARIQVTDAAGVNTPFYNSNAPTQPTYINKSPTRQNLVVFEVKAGTAATTGSQVTPTPDSGWVPLYAVTVDYGESSLTSADIALAANAPQFYGFVHVNPNGNTPVYLSPAAQQTGTINISGTATLGGVVATTALLGGASATTNFEATFKNGLAGDYAELTATGFTGSKQATDSLNIAGSIGYTGAHAGTDADPFPLSQLNVAMLGGKLASDYALASGHYLTLYSGAPSADPTNVNAAIGGYFQANVAQGTAPIQVVSTTQCPNLNAQFVGGLTPGNASGDIPISNGTLNSNLNAQYLNGLASSAFQPAGSYAVLNATNTGYFAASGAIQTTGGTGSAQASINYATTNGFGLNNGGALGYVQSANAPLGLVGSSVRTNGPLYVGDENPQNTYMQDVVPSGVLRSGTCVYTVTYGGTSNSHPYPGNGTAWGTYGSNAGQIEIATDGVLNAVFYIGYRTKITLNGSLTVQFQGLGKCSGTVYVDNAYVGTVGGQMNGFSYTFSAGTHTVDIVYTSTSMGAEYYEGGYGTSHDQGGSLTVFGWLPLSSGQISSAITALAPG